jgi:hypothetical protein
MISRRAISKKAKQTFFNSTIQKFGNYLPFELSQCQAIITSINKFPMLTDFELNHRNATRQNQISMSHLIEEIPTCSSRGK